VAPADDAAAQEGAPQPPRPGGPRDLGGAGGGDVELAVEDGVDDELELVGVEAVAAVVVQEPEEGPAPLSVVGLQALRPQACGAPGAPLGSEEGRPAVRGDLAGAVRQQGEGALHGRAPARVEEPHAGPELLLVGVVDRREDDVVEEIEPDDEVEEEEEEVRAVFVEA